MEPAKGRKRKGAGLGALVYGTVRPRRALLWPGSRLGSRRIHSCFYVLGKSACMRTDAMDESSCIRHHLTGLSPGHFGGQRTSLASSPTNSTPHAPHTPCMGPAPRGSSICMPRACAWQAGRGLVGVPRHQMSGVATPVGSSSCMAIAVNDPACALHRIIRGRGGAAAAVASAARC